MTAPLIEVLRRQGRICASLGSPMYGELLDLIASDVESGGVFADVLRGHDDDPIGSAIALRLTGGLHRLAFDESAPELARWYPSVGGTWDGAAAWPDITAAARTHQHRLTAALAQVPQTNEVGRSAALIGALLRFVGQNPRPVRLFEIGASAGLNLRADRYLYRFEDGQWGPTDSPVVIENAWQGMRPPQVPLRIVERHGFDIAPVNAVDDDGRLALLSYVWPDMPARLDRLRGAIEIARRVPAGLDRMSAADAVAGLRLVRGTLTVLWHSITWQYLTADEQAAVTARAVELGMRADAATPFVWLSLEPVRRSPEARHEFLVRARCWPEGSDEVVGSCSPHGPPVHWD